MGTLVSMLFFVTLVVVAILIFLLSQKNDTIANLVVNINELENDMYKLQREINKREKELCSINNKLEQEIKKHTNETEILNGTIFRLKEDKAELSKDRKNIMERLNYSKNKVEEEREIRKQTEEHLNVIISQLDKEKNKYRKI